MFDATKSGKAAAAVKHSTGVWSRISQVSMKYFRNLLKFILNFHNKITSQRSYIVVSVYAALFSIFAAVLSLIGKFSNLVADNRDAFLETLSPTTLSLLVEKPIPEVITLLPLSLAEPPTPPMPSSQRGDANTRGTPPEKIVTNISNPTEPWTDSTLNTPQVTKTTTSENPNISPGSGKISFLNKNISIRVSGSGNIDIDNAVEEEMSKDLSKKFSLVGGEQSSSFV